MGEKHLFRIVHVAEDMAKVSGGIPAVVCQLSAHLASSCNHIDIAHATGNPRLALFNTEVHNFPPSGWGNSWSLGPSLRLGLSNLISPNKESGQILHIHGAWSAPQFFAARRAHKVGVPFVFTAHGMLEPWLWNQQGWRIKMKKEAYWAAMAYPALKNASALHAITPLERDSLSRLFPRKSISVIPNAIEVSERDLGHPAQAERTKSILFLGRIEPKKGVDILLHAFSITSIGKEWAIDIVGPIWSDAYMESLRSIAKKSGIGDRVRFYGPVFGEEKLRLIDRAWVLAAPSHSEVMGLVNLEASARCLPSITTYQTGLHDWERGGGILIEPSINALKRALENACSWSDLEQRERGLSSQRLVFERYSWHAVKPQWIELYNSLL